VDSHKEEGSALVFLGNKMTSKFSSLYQKTFSVICTNSKVYELHDFYKGRGVTQLQDLHKT
jgi:hypothetical protein